jgi:hypothetical protein
MAQQFQQFAQLPTEIRRKIWQCAIPYLHRIIEAKPTRETIPDGTDYDRLNRSSDLGGFPIWKIEPHEAFSHPLLIVSGESRHVFLSSTYKIFYPATFIEGNSDFPFNFDTDVLYIREFPEIWRRKKDRRNRMLLSSLFGLHLQVVTERLRYSAGKWLVWDNMLSVFRLNYQQKCLATELHELERGTSSNPEVWIA